jgi:ubiquinone/menaquinone biosynthesis C-methylase UbiE
LIKVGHHLSDAEIEQRYSEIAGTLGMPGYFYGAVAAFPAARSGARLLDVGCGNGDLLRELEGRFEGSLLAGVEISSGRLRLARERLGGRVSLLQTGGKGALPFEDGSFDFVFVTEVLEHLKQPEALLAEARRVLSPGGRLVLTTPNADAFLMWPLFARVAEAAPGLPLVRRLLPHEHPLRTLQPIDTLLTRGDVEALLERSGFRVLRVAGRETLPALFSLPGLRWLDYRGWLPRGLLDGLLGRVSGTRFAYRLFWECTRV